MIVPLAVLVGLPLAAFILSIILGEKHVGKANILFSVILIFYGIVFYSYYAYLGFPIIHIKLYSTGTLGEVYGFIVDPFSASMALIISIVAGAIMLYSTNYMSPQNNYHPVVTGKPRFYAWMYLFIFSVILFVFSSNLVQLLINFELMSLACWGLISYYGTPEAARSSYKMLVITHLGAYGGLGAAIGYLALNYGSVSLSILSSLSPSGKLLVLGLIMWAAITKSSQFPTYSWLPDAMVAPTPTSALLHGATMIEMGPYLVARIIYSMGSVPVNAQYIILVPIVFSVVISTLMYPVLKDGKRLLAYSTIAEAAIMYFTVSLMIYSFRLGLSLFLLYFTAHAFLKSLGFLLMGSAGYSVGTHDLTRIIGYFSSSKFMYNLLLCVLLGLSGVPLFSIAKAYMVILSGLVLDKPIYLTALLAVLAESAVLLAVSMHWFGSRRASARSIHSLPPYMYASFIILLVGLYLSQICAFTVMIPSIYRVM